MTLSLGRSYAKPFLTIAPFNLDYTCTAELPTATFLRPFRHRESSPPRRPWLTGTAEIFGQQMVLWSYPMGQHDLHAWPEYALTTAEAVNVYVSLIRRQKCK